MNRRSQSRASSIDWIGRCLPGSIRGMANSLAGMRYRLPRNITSKRRCSRHLLPFLQLRSVHLRLMVITPPSWLAPLQLVYDTRVGAPRLIQSSTSAGWKRRPRTPNRCDVSKPREYARRTVSSWQPMYSATSNAVNSRFGRPPVAGAVVLAERRRRREYWLLVDVQLFPHRVLRESVAPPCAAAPMLM